MTNFNVTMQAEPATSLTPNLFQRKCNFLSSSFYNHYLKNKHKEQLSQTQLQMHHPVPLSSVRSSVFSVWKL